MINSTSVATFQGLFEPRLFSGFLDNVKTTLEELIMQSEYNLLKIW